MELPFLKNKQKNQGGGGPVDAGSGDLIGHVLDELLQAFDTKDKALLLDALRAVIQHVQSEGDDE